jgi:hypothetical protein
MTSAFYTVRRKFVPHWPAMAAFGLLFWTNQAFAQPKVPAANAAGDCALLPPLEVAPDKAPEKLAAPAAADPAAPDNGQASGGGESFWSRVPPVFTTPRTGYFLILPSGPGYYSLRDVIEGNVRDDRPKYPTAPIMLSPVFTPFFDAITATWKIRTTRRSISLIRSSASTWVTTGCSRSAEKSVCATWTKTTAV